MEQDVQKMFDTHTGRYLLVNAISLRVRALQSGYKPLVPRGSNELDAVAIEEFRQDKIRVDTIEGEKKEAQEGQSKPKE